MAANDNKSTEWGKVIVAFLLFAVPIFIKYYSYQQFEPVLRESQIGTLDGRPKVHLNYVMPLGYTLANLCADALITLGCSFIISMFIISKVESSLAEEKRLDLEQLQAQIRENVISSVFGTLVDQEIFDVFRHGVITNGVVKKDAKWTYDFTILGRNRIRLLETDRYELHNRTGADRIETINSSYDNVAGQPSLKSFVCVGGAETIEFTDKDLVEDADNPGTRVACNGKVKVIESKDGRTDIAIQVIIKSKSKVSVDSLYETVYESSSVTDSFFTSYPLVNADLEVNLPENHEFFLFTALSTDLEIAPVVQPLKRLYRARGGILPNQGFIFTMKPLSSS